MSISGPYKGNLCKDRLFYIKTNTLNMSQLFITNKKREYKRVLRDLMEKNFDNISSGAWKDNRFTSDETANKPIDKSMTGVWVIYDREDFFIHIDEPDDSEYDSFDYNTGDGQHKKFIKFDKFHTLY